MPWSPCVFASTSRERRRIAEGARFREAVRFAVAASALSVTRLGAQDSLPTRAEVEALLGG